MTAKRPVLGNRVFGVEFDGDGALIPRIRLMRERRDLWKIGALTQNPARVVVHEPNIPAPIATLSWHSDGHPLGLDCLEAEVAVGTTCDEPHLLEPRPAEREACKKRDKHKRSDG